MHRPGIIGARPHHGGAPYVGPLDIVPGAVVASSVARALSSAMRGRPLITIADGAGGATRSFSSDATTGASPDTAIQAYSAAPFVSLLNDQSGNANNTAQSNAALQPQWIALGQGGRPEIKFVPSILATDNPVAFPSGGATIAAVYRTEVAQNFSDDTPIVSAFSPNDFTNELFFEPVTLARYPSPPEVTLTDIPAILRTVDGNTHLIVAAVSNSAAYLYVDGVLQPDLFVGLGDFIGVEYPFYIGDDSPDGTDIPLKGRLQEIVIWPFVVVNPAPVMQNMIDFYAIPPT